MSECYVPLWTVIDIISNYTTLLDTSLFDLLVPGFYQDVLRGKEECRCSLSEGTTALPVVSKWIADISITWRLQHQRAFQRPELNIARDVTRILEEERTQKVHHDPSNVQKGLLWSHWQEVRSWKLLQTCRSPWETVRNLNDLRWRNVKSALLNPPSTHQLPFFLFTFSAMKSSWTSVRLKKGFIMIVF